MRLTSRLGSMVAAFAILGAVLTAGCVSSVKPETTQPRTVSIGALLPLTGDASSIGANVNSTIHAAEADVNSYLAAADAGIRVQLVAKDTGTTPEGALAAMKVLRGDGVTAVVGPYSSAELKAVAPYADQNGMVLIAYGSTATSLDVERTNVFRVVPDDSHQGPAIAEVLQDTGAKLFLPFVRDDIYGNGLVNATRAAFEEQGGVVSDGLRFSANATNFTDVLNAVRPQLDQAIAEYGRKSIGVLFIGFENNTMPMLTAASNDAQWSTVSWYGVAATPVNSILINKTAAQAAARLNYTAVQQVEGQGECYDRLVQNASVRGTVQTPYGSFAYDAMQIISRALAEVGTQNSTALRDAIPRVASSYVGITGDTTLNAVGDRAYANYDLWTIKAQNGTYLKIKTAQFRSGPLSGAYIVQGARC